MTLECPACGAAREIAASALAQEGLVRCAFCRTVFDPHPDSAAPGGAATEVAAGQRESARDRWFVDVMAGVYGPTDLASLGRWIREGRVDWEDLVSHDGGVWLPALEQRLLVESFHAVGDAEALPAGADGTAACDAPPIKVRPKQVSAQDVRRSVRTVAAGLAAFSLLTLNLPGVVVGAGLFRMRAWARRAALALLGILSLGALGGMIWASVASAWAFAACGAVAVGLAAAAAAVLLRRPVRASFYPGGALRAAVAVALSAVVSLGLGVGGWRALERAEASRRVTGVGYAYSLSRPSDAWIALPAPRPVTGQPEADLEIAREDGRARLVVAVDEQRGDAAQCLAESLGRIRASGRNPTVYQRQKVSAAGIIGEQGIASVELAGGRRSFLLTCYVTGGQRYQVIGVADARVFEAMRPELARLATSFRIEEPDDPMQLDIQTRPAAVLAPPPEDPASLAGVVERSQRAVVTITAHLGGQRRAYGSGALLAPDGLVVTNYHVIEGARKIMVRIPGRGSRRATLAAKEPAIDLAILTVKGADLPFLSLAGAPVRAGDDVIAIGSPMGLAHTVTKGIISSTRRARGGVHYLQTDVSINPGNSGGPLLNLAGEVVGINTFIVRESEHLALTGLNFAVPAAYVREIATAAGFSIPRSAAGASPAPKNASPS